MIITVYDNNNGELLACIDTEAEDYIKREDVNVLIQKNNTEPVFTMNNNGNMVLCPNAFLIKL